MTQDLQINRLRTLTAVVDHGGFRRAASVLCITQPAVSQQIRHLDRFIKGPVFASTGRELRLTPRGEELLGYARRIVALNDETVERFLTAVPSGERLVIGVGDQLAEALPEVLTQLTTVLTRAKISFRTAASASLEAAVDTDGLDLAVLIDPSDRASSTLSDLELGSVRLGWFGESADEGDRLPLTLPTEPSSLRGKVIGVLDAESVPWHVAYEGSDLPGLRAAMKTGIGVGCLLDNGDRLWGLPRPSKRSLPAPPHPVPLALRVGRRSGVSRSTVKVTRSALQRAFATYPLA
ncbi:hypothetical protein GCM10028784_20230 [Myceligenerans cantabricum]